LTDASIPNPMHRATEVDANVVLSWEPPFQDAPAEYTVNIAPWGQDMTSAVVATNSYAPAGLKPGTTYRWRVDISEPNDLPGGVPTLREGTEWLFTTASIKITEQPSLASVPAGSDVTFSVTAESTFPLSYQWRKDGEDLPGEEASTLSLSAVGDVHEGIYSCVVSTDFDSVESSGAALGIDDPDRRVAYWSLDGHTQDMSGNGYHLIADPDGNSGFADSVRPALGQAAMFDGAADSLIQLDPNFPVGDALNWQPGITVACWIKSNIYDTDKGFIIFQPPAGNDDVDMRYDEAGASGGGDAVLKMGVTTTAGILQLETLSMSQATDWQHVVMTWEKGGRIRGYLNGLESGYTAQSGAANALLTGFEHVILGRGGKDTTEATTGWNGLIDEVYIYNYAFTPADVLEFYWLQTGQPGEVTCLPGTGGPMDLNGDCVVNILDLIMFVPEYLYSNVVE
jgi:hypothetical protein